MCLYKCYILKTVLLKQCWITYVKSHEELKFIDEQLEFRIKVSEEINADTTKTSFQTKANILVVNAAMYNYFNKKAMKK